MKINHQILSIPPHISTSWKNISSIHVVEKETGPVLIVNLSSGQIVEIPGLEKEILHEIFEAHSSFLEQETKEPEIKESKESSPLNFGIPLKFGIEGLEGFGSVMQHNPGQANMPNLPTEVLEKISNLSKALGISESNEGFLKAEPHCNCMYCQIARAIQDGAHGPSENSPDEIEEEISEEDLKFREWDINQTSDKLYVVTNPFNQAEHYQVFLGEPIGCTCGQKNCEHVRAVLNS